MKNVIEILDRYHQSFISQKRNWDFFLGLADYVKYATETSEIDKILKSIVQKRVNADKKLKKYEEDAIKEAKEVIKDKLFQKIKKEKISYEELNKLMQEWDDYAKKRILSSQSDAEALSGCLIDIIRSLHDANYKEITKDFIIEEEADPKIIKEFTCFKKLDLYKKERLAYQEKEEIELWGAWGNLVLVYIVIFKSKEEIERLRKDKRNWWTTFNLQGLIGEMQKIKGQSAFSDSKPVWFIKDAYIGYATRIHNYLIRELSKKEGEEIKQRKVDYAPLFDKDKSILIIGVNEIKIQKFSDQYHLLRIVFEDKLKDWQFSEIAELIDSEKAFKWKNLYNSTNEIKKKIAIETGIKDFFITTTQSIKINEKYLKKS